MAATAETGKLPDGVDPDTAIEEFWFPLPIGHIGRTGPLTISLHETFSALREHGEATLQELTQDAFNGEWLASTGWTATQWREELIDLYLARLPGVEHEGRTWRYAPENARRPSVPDDPQQPSDNEEATLLDDLDVHGAHGGGRRNRIGVRDAYRHLREHGSATREDLVTVFTPSDVYQPTYERYDEPREWWVRVGAPMLSRLPDVDAPLMPAGEWRYVGLRGGDR